MELRGEVWTEKGTSGITRIEAVFETIYSFIESISKGEVLRLDRKESTSKSNGNSVPLEAGGKAREWRATEAKAGSCFQQED